MALGFNYDAIEKEYLQPVLTYLVVSRVIQTTKPFGSVDNQKINFYVTVEYMLLFGRGIFLEMLQ